MKRAGDEATININCLRILPLVLCGLACKSGSLLSSTEDELVLDYNSINVNPIDLYPL